jgi:RNA polymerase sigma-70 factor (ECF subfamily)
VAALAPDAAAPEDSAARDRSEVAELLKSRDDAVFRSLYARHTPALYALALRLLGDRRQEAEDVIQETWIRAVGGLRRFAWQSSLRTWLCSIVVNCCREAWRQAREQLVVEEVHLGSEMHDIAGRIDVTTALARLPTGYRAVLVLHDIMGLTHEEIAERLEIEAGTSKSQLSRARRAMRRALGAAPIGT